MLAVDERGGIWTWANWAEVGRLSASWLHSKSWRVADLAAGWDLSAVLTEMIGENRYKGVQRIQVWWQRFLAPTLRTVDTLGAPGPDRMHGKNGCYYFTPSQVITLPDLPPPASSQHDEQKHDRVSKLAAGEEFLIVLTEQGRVYKMDLSCPALPPDAQEGDNEPLIDDGTIGTRRFAGLEAMFASGRREWEFLPNFSTELGTTNRINHISASFRSFFTIGKGKVLQGQREFTSASQPVAMPALQDRGVIRYVVLLLFLYPTLHTDANCTVSSAATTTLARLLLRASS